MNERYTIDQLCERTGFTRRTIHFYVNEGLIDPPAGRGRGGFYNDSQLRPRSAFLIQAMRRIVYSPLQSQVRRLQHGQTVLLVLRLSPARSAARSLKPLQAPLMLVLSPLGDQPRQPCLPQLKVKLVRHTM